MGKVLSISNHKGGLEKQLLLLIWSGLNKLGKKVCYDLDPQEFESKFRID
jgi:hypothetical protein